MVLLKEEVYTEKGIIYPCAVKIIRKDRYRYVIKRDDLTAYVTRDQLRFIKDMK